MTPTAAIRIDAQDCAPARWDAPARGTLSWRTLFSGEVQIEGASHRLVPSVALYFPGRAAHGVPVATGPMRWFYTFARDRLDQIAYHFTHEDPAGAQRPE